MLEGGAIEVRSLADHAFDRLLEAITLGELEPGTRLSETLLARQLGVSRGPLREAIRRLEGRKLVVRTPNVGPHIVSLTPADLVEIFHIREHLEGLAVRFAAERMSNAELDRVEQRLETHARDRDLVRGNGYFQRAGDQDFHYLIVQGSRSPRLIELLCNDLYYLLRIYRFRSSGVTGRAKIALDEHRAILAAMRARDADRCEKLMRSHIAAARENLVVGLRADTDAELERPDKAFRVVDITPSAAAGRGRGGQKLR